MLRKMAVGLFGSYLSVEIAELRDEIQNTGPLPNESNKILALVQNRKPVNV
jgi:hypothetical protein